MASASVYVDGATEVVFNYLCPKVVVGSCFQAYYLLVF